MTTAQTDPIAKSGLNPVAVLERLLVVNPVQAKFLLTGMGVFAALAIVSTYRVDLSTAGNCLLPLAYALLHRQQELRDELRF
jgi:hypothetical protein